MISDMCCLCGVWTGEDAMNDGCYVSWNAYGRPVLTAQNFGRDSRWFATEKEALAAIAEWEKGHPEDEA